MLKKKRKSKNSGIVKFYLQSNAKASYSAKINVKSISDMHFVKSKFFSIETARQEDIEFAESLSRSLSLKIKTHFDNELESKHKALIGNTLFDIIKIDHDHNNRETYIYLEEFGKIEK